MELADTSVWAHKSHPALRDWFASAVEAGEIAGCDMDALELLHSARNPPEFAPIGGGRGAGAGRGRGVGGRAAPPRAPKPSRVCPDRGCAAGLVVGRTRRRGLD